MMSNNKTQQINYIVDQTLVINYMNNEFLTISNNWSAREVYAYLLNQFGANNIPDIVFITTESEHYLLGYCLFSSLLHCDNLDVPISALMESIVIYASPYEHRSTISQLLKKCDIDFIPILKNNKLIGVLGRKELSNLLKDDFIENIEKKQHCSVNTSSTKNILSFNAISLWRNRIAWIFISFLLIAYTNNYPQTLPIDFERAIALFSLISFGYGTQVILDIETVEKHHNLHQLLKKELLAATLVSIPITITYFIYKLIMSEELDEQLLISTVLFFMIIISALLSAFSVFLAKNNICHPVSIYPIGIAIIYCIGHTILFLVLL